LRSTSRVVVVFFGLGFFVGLGWVVMGMVVGFALGRVAVNLRARVRRRAMVVLVGVD
jgi:hypothetical protein